MRRHLFPLLLAIAAATVVVSQDAITASWECQSQSQPKTNVLEATLVSVRDCTLSGDLVITAVATPSPFTTLYVQGSVISGALKIANVRQAAGLAISIVDSQIDSIIL